MFGLRKYAKFRGGRFSKSWRRNFKPFNSFVSLSSRARVTPSKRRKIDAISRENDEDASVSIRPAQNQNTLITSLSNVRFKDISSSTFDYHHFARRIHPANVTFAAGAAGTVSYTTYGVRFSDIADYSEIAGLYARYRITRLVFEFQPLFNIQSLYTYGSIRPPIVYHRIYRANEAQMLTEANALTDTDVVVHSNMQPFQVSLTPNVTEDNEMKESGAATSLTTLFSPWIRTSEVNVWHYGLECLVVNTSTVVEASNLYSCICTLYFDVADAGI